jgi:murein DD-endopeptidase MepM/ murein hydrolase activator NlpD
MKKAYVKTKQKGVKNLLSRSYIVATVLGAALCAGILSFVLNSSGEPEVEQIQVTEIEPVQIAEIVPVEEPLPEVIPTEPPEILEVPQKEEAESVGMFSQEELKIKLPVQGKITNQYSDSKPVKNEATGVWQTHNGIDIEAKKGDEVTAPAEGKVISAGKNALYQNSVTIDHGNGYVSTIFNLESLNISVGDVVKQGQKIGTAGEGAAVESDTSPHVHLEIKKNGKYTDPNKYIE